MDASTLAALSLAMDESRDAALRELLQERERDRMQAEDLRSFVAQRHFTASQLVPGAPRPVTWEAAYARRHNDLHWAHGTMRDALRWVRSGDDVRAERLLAAELGSDEEEEAEEESDEEAALVCVLCGREPAGGLLTMAAEGRWAGLEPGARQVCSACHTEALGPVL